MIEFKIKQYISKPQTEYTFQSQNLESFDPHGNIMASKRPLEDQTDEPVSKKVKTLAYEIHEACTTYLNASKVELLIKSFNTDDAMKQEIIKDLNAMKTLHEVCTSKGLEIAQQLLSLGLQINSFNSEGDSPLQIACQNRCPPLVEELLRHGANPNTRCPFDNRTPLPR